MASLPSQASWQRHSSPEQTPPSAASESLDSGASTSSKSQTIHLNNPRSSSADTDTTAFESPSKPNVVLDCNPPDPSRERKRCWVCLNDDTEDTPESTPWRKVCPCSLNAHESCLLEWITSEEAPKKGDLATSKKLLCPQCKAEIKIQRPQSIIVNLTEMTMRISKHMVVPTGLFGILGSTYSGLWLYGYSSMNLVFGLEETKRMFGYSLNKDVTQQLSWFSRPLAVMNPFFLNRALQGSEQGVDTTLLYLGLPLVAPTLIFLRTQLLDQAFAVAIPMFFFWEREVISWPPKPNQAFATIPLIKAAYKELYRYAFGELEKKWEYAVQRKPREGETAEQIAAQAEEENNDAVIGLEIGFDEEEVVDPAQVAHNVGPGGVDAPGEGVQRNNRNGNNNQWNIEENISTSRIASTIMGALFFPAISSAMGSLLKYTLPRSWVLSEKLTGSKGLLKEQWGRSLIGGCLFVVLKDAVLLYCKWRKARDFGKRKVLEWAPPKEKKAGRTAVR